MTTPRRDGGGTPFNEWIRALPRPLDSSENHYTDADGLWFAYNDGWNILVEAKTHGNWRWPPSTVRERSQWDNLAVTAQQMARGSREPISTWRGRRVIEFRGLYVLSLSGESPEDSESVSVAWLSGLRGDQPERRWKSIHPAIVQIILRFGGPEAIDAFLPVMRQLQLEASAPRCDGSCALTGELCEICRADIGVLV